MIDTHLWYLGLFSFLSSTLGHIVFWRAFPNKQNLILLCAIFFLAPLIPYGFYLVDSTLTEPLVVALLVHYVCAAHYIMIYPAFNPSSPTLNILFTLRKHSDGLTKQEIESHTVNSALLEDRVVDLEKGNLIRLAEGKPVITLKGRALALVFVLYRRIVGLPEGVG